MMFVANLYYFCDRFTVPICSVMEAHHDSNLIERVRILPGGQCVKYPSLTRKNSDNVGYFIQNHRFLFNIIDIMAS